MTHGSVAAKVRVNKEKHPEKYCPAKNCLWLTGGGFCPRHSTRGYQELETKQLQEETK